MVCLGMTYLQTVLAPEYKPSPGPVQLQFTRHRAADLVSNERSMASNDTDNRAEKGSLENKKIPLASFDATAGGQVTGEGIGAASRP